MELLTNSKPFPCLKTILSAKIMDYFLYIVKKCTIVWSHTNNLI